MRYLAFGFHCSAFQSKLTSTCNALSQSRLQSPVEFLISLYREHGSKRPFCDSIFDLKEQLVALQLVMTKLNKEVRDTVVCTGISGKRNNKEVS